VSRPATDTNVLDAIVARTRQHVAAERVRRPLDEVQEAARSAPGPRRFAAALSRAGRVNVIAEHKRRSPSRGAIREDLAPAEVARGYERAGAAAISVLTDEPFFGGRLEHLAEARAATRLPVLRKDFVVDPWQVWETRAAGADAVLLIVAVLGDDELSQLLTLAAEVGLDALVEVHDRDELERALGAGSRMVGVNNRNLKTMEVSLATAVSLCPAIPDGVVKVAESGIRTGEDVRCLREAGFDAFLIGERLMSDPDPGQALLSLIEESA
jgi:indole-3-glycerol phosphate synthase